MAFFDNYKTLTLSNGTSYGCVYIASLSSKPTLLFLHGFPSGAYDWRHQILHFSSKGYGVLVPDLLGYGGTDKPPSVSEYRGKKMASEIVEILDYEKLHKVHGVGHDWGSFLLSRLANYYPHRFSSYSFLAAGYTPPGGQLDIEAINTASMSVLGYESAGYWKFFAKDDAAGLVKDHMDSFYSLTYPEDPGVWKSHMAPTGALEAWLRSDRISPMASYVTHADKQIHQQIFKDGYGAAMNWYRVQMQNLNQEDEKSLALNISQPVLLITATKDAIGIPAMMKRSIQKYVKALTVREVDTGHWVQLEAKEKVNAYLEDFISVLRLSKL